MLLHDNYITFFVNFQAVVFHSTAKCASCIVCLKCIFAMADNDKTLIGENNLKNRISNITTIPTLTSNTHPETHALHHASISEPTTLKRKQTSFQITSVTVQGSRLSTDGGEDSADDLDESHTEDASSDILDCSRTTDVDNDQLSEDNSNANNDDATIPAPSIPVKCKTEVSVKSDVLTNTQTMKPPADSSVVTTEKPCTSPKPHIESVVNPPTLPDQWQHRFRVVKIVSSEPFKRGRWLCMDFMDPPAPAVETKSEESTSNLSAQPGSDNSGQDSSLPSDRIAHIYEISPSDAYPGSVSVAVGSDQIQQPMYGIFLSVNNSQYPFASDIKPEVVPVILQKETSQVASATNPPISQNFSSSFTDQSAFTCQQTPTIAPIPSQQQQVPVQVTNVQASSMQQSQSSLSSTASVSASQHISTSGATSTNTVQPQMIPDSQQTMQQQMQPASQQSQVLPVTTSPNVQQPTSCTTIASSASQVSDMPQIQVNPSSSGGKLPQFHQIPPVSSTQTSSVGTQASVIPNIPEASVASSQKVQETINVPSQEIQNHIETKELGTPPSTNTQILQDVLPESLPTKSDINGEDSESVPSGASTVAIDNKIEQAMDLVKSHLMFAVREEVDVLKEKITELMDRISQLEYENGFLKANASQQTLDQLNQSQLLQQQQQNQSTNIVMNSLPQVTQTQINIQNQQPTS